MTQIKDFPDRTNPVADDFLYLITQGNTDYKILINSILGRMIKSIIDPVYQLVASDAYHTVRLLFPASTVVTVPLEATTAFAIGTTIKIRNNSTLNAILAPETIAVTLNTKSGLNISQKGEIELVYIGSDEWDISGDLI